jgi:hypothetical protein
VFGPTHCVTLPQLDWGRAAPPPRASCWLGCEQQVRRYRDRAPVFVPTWGLPPEVNAFGPDKEASDFGLAFRLTAFRRTRRTGRTAPATAPSRFRIKGTSTVPSAPNRFTTCSQGSSLDLIPHESWRHACVFRYRHGRPLGVRFIAADKEIRDMQKLTRGLVAVAVLLLAACTQTPTAADPLSARYSGLRASGVSTAGQPAALPNAEATTDTTTRNGGVMFGSGN